MHSTSSVSRVQPSSLPTAHGFSSSDPSINSIVPDRSLLLCDQSSRVLPVRQEILVLVRLGRWRFACDLARVHRVGDQSAQDGDGFFQNSGDSGYDRWRNLCILNILVGMHLVDEQNWYCDVKKNCRSVVFLSASCTNMNELTMSTFWLSKPAQFE